MIAGGVHPLAALYGLGQFESVEHAEEHVEQVQPPTVLPVFPVRFDQLKKDRQCTRAHVQLATTEK